jgi:hypothetical protein
MTLKLNHIPYWGIDTLSAVEHINHQCLKQITQYVILESSRYEHQRHSTAKDIKSSYHCLQNAIYHNALFRSRVANLSSHWEYPPVCRTILFTYHCLEMGSTVEDTDNDPLRCHTPSDLHSTARPDNYILVCCN